MPRYRYKYYADYDGGSFIADDLEKLCQDIKRKFWYLHEIPDRVSGKQKGQITDEDMFLWNSIDKVGLDSGYLTRNCFGRGRYGHRFYLLNTYAFQLGHEHFITIRRFLI